MKKFILFVMMFTLFAGTFARAEQNISVGNAQYKPTELCPEPCEEVGVKAKVICEEAKKSNCMEAATAASKACLAKGCK